ncbi:type II toxin-antitoxin system VapC family toxin [Azohydromonas lata]|uniref:PIN domain-containing protein n=1 Tax=Azohydromonas lata TaxID=45677 RepID=A0ABU5IRM0_9BURK|nr:PIN domain-containing protein [Azohydromonas lata]MDZ5461533.1 PIN domain-containing protein [Azohydromonas lata]
MGPLIAYLDANALIYLLEGQADTARQVRRCLEELAQEAGRVTVAMSRLSWMECRIKPLRDGDTALLLRYDSFFAAPDLRWMELDRGTVELATTLRACHGLRTPDALQAAGCLLAGQPHAFITGDQAFAKVAGLACRFVCVKAAGPPSA